MRISLRILAGIIILSSLFSCAPDMERPINREIKKVDTLTTDSIPIIQLSDTVSELTIRITDQSVIVESGNVNTVYNVDVERIVLSRSETGLIEYLQINNEILYKEVNTKHNYVYLDNNTILIRKGNTINGILSDYKLTRKDLFRCNPFLTRGLRVDDQVRISCD